MGHCSRIFGLSLQFCNCLLHCSYLCFILCQCRWLPSEPRCNLGVTCTDCRLSLEPTSSSSISDFARRCHRCICCRTCCSSRINFGLQICNRLLHYRYQFIILCSVVSRLFASCCHCTFRRLVLFGHLFQLVIDCSELA